MLTTWCNEKAADLKMNENSDDSWTDIYEYIYDIYMNEKENWNPFILDDWNEFDRKERFS